MGPDFLDIQYLWCMFCCNFICLQLFLGGYPAIRQTKPDIRQDAGYEKGRLDILCNPIFVDSVNVVGSIQK